MMFLYIEDDNCYYKNKDDKFRNSWFNFEIIGINIYVISILLVNGINKLVEYELMKFYKIILKKKERSKYIYIIS